MTTYRYQGTTVTALPLKTGDVILHPGASVELPEDVDVVRTLAAKRLLVEADIPLDPPSKGDLQEAGGDAGAPSAETPAVPDAGEDAGGPSRKSKKGA